MKLGCSHAGEPEVVKSLIIQDDLTWYIHMKAHKMNSNSTILATLLQFVNSLSCLMRYWLLWVLAPCVGE